MSEPTISIDAARVELLLKELRLPGERSCQSSATPTSNPTSNFACGLRKDWRSPRNRAWVCTCGDGEKRATGLSPFGGSPR
jgi:hypothetical protein